MKSMTGYGYKEYSDENYFLSVEIKSWNSRFLDLSVYLPSFLGRLEKQIREKCSTLIFRGKVDLSIKLKEKNTDITVSVDENAAKAYSDAIKSIAKSLDFPSENIPLSLVVNQEGVLNVQKNTDFEKYKVVYKLIDESISNDAPYVIKDGNVIKKGYSKELDELKNINLDSKNYILSLETKEKEKTGIKTLKVGYNKVFGYYIEVSKLQSELVKDEYGYIRKQTLSNAERYITQELKEKEALILRAEEKTLELEQKLFTEVRNKLKEYTNELQTLAKTLAELDMMLSFTKVSNDNKYVRPTLNDNGSINIKDGRHPVIETNLKVNYVSNDLKMSPDDSILLITGPNMSGKSTYMRQVALTAIMAQIGCFVPCKSADIPIFDQIFTRIGASDDIVSGQSTFMVEMMEVNNALQNATKNSLILFDEIGRGTATYDGMALAQAIIEYVHDKIGCKTLFSTHYHELTSLESSLSKLKNVHVSAEEVKGEVVFLHKVKQGAIDKSYGINVAKLAKINLDIILRATDILNKLQENENYDKDKLAPYNYVAPLVYDSKTEVEEEIINKLKHLNIYEMNPMDAMNLLNELKNKLN